MKLKSLLKSFLLLVMLTVVAVIVYVQTSPPYKHVWQKAAPNVYELIGEGGAGGTGFQLIASDGKTIIVTNSHICELAPSKGENKGLLLVKKNGQKLKRKVLLIDITADLCLVEPWPIALGLKLGDEVKEGDKVLAIGHPHLGPLKMVDGEVTGQKDIVVMHHLMSTGNRQLDKFLHVPNKTCRLPKNEVGSYIPQLFSLFATEGVPVCLSREKDAIQTNVQIFPGNSGSPLLNTSGEVVGVVFATESDSHYGWAVNLDHLKRILKHV